MGTRAKAYPALPAPSHVGSTDWGVQPALLLRPQWEEVPGRAGWLPCRCLLSGAIFLSEEPVASAGWVQALPGHLGSDRGIPRLTADPVLLLSF